LAIFRVPLPLYRAGWGWLLGRTFLLLVHVGRKTGTPHVTVAMVLRYDPGTGEGVICSVWGPNTDWVRNLRAHPALQVQIGRQSFTRQQRFLSEDESFAVAVEFLRRHPWRLRLVGRVLGWDDLRSDDAVRRFIHSRPFVACAQRPRPEMRRPRVADQVWRRGIPGRLAPHEVEGLLRPRCRWSAVIPRGQPEVGTR
jgi:deazaflavin-dependent oxidoreductase (nitroreductase family)